MLTFAVARAGLRLAGQLSDGNAFERTLVTSVAVGGQDGKLPLPASLKADVSAQP